MKNLDDVDGWPGRLAPHYSAFRVADRLLLTDHRRDVLRFGPAPYLFDSQIDEAMEHLGEVARGIGRSG